MSDVLRGQPLDVLLRWILTELKDRGSIFGIPRVQFHTPTQDAPYQISNLFGQRLGSPIGPAAGPQTQLAQNIVSAWLCGARFIELKTVQVMDELDIPRPCIDMADEGYNVEWSQELRLEQSAREYVKAWVLIHILRRVLGFEGRVPFGTIFNMSVGYDLEGIQSPPMVRFMDRMTDASELLEDVRATLYRTFPEFSDVEVPTKMVNNVTVSTMHGCPPAEIERIAEYLLKERKLHTSVKLNPTLLGKEHVREILHERLGFTEIEIPDRIFDDDLQYDRALELIRNLQAVAEERDLTFGVKLSNTLAMENHRDVLPGDEMYMSGRALYPITMNLYHRLLESLDGGLDVSYSAGANAFNVVDILAAGARPVTMVSDLLKPGGYGRLKQYLEQLDLAMSERGAESLDDLAADRRANLARAAQRALSDPRYKKGYHPYELPKVPSALELFDCVTAPCMAQCAICQDVPEYAWLIATGEYDRALEVILDRNPLPGVLGYVCTHLCQTRCTRSNYDQPVEIRALKRFAFEHGDVTLRKASDVPCRVAIIGSGPSGLAAAYFLALNGIEAKIFEGRDRPGGMLAIAPVFRLPEEVVDADIDRILQLGVEIELEHPIEHPPEDLLEQGFDAVYVASGAQRGVRLGIDGEGAEGVHDALDFLARVRQGERVDLGERVLVIGGGNSAMDAARTAKRLVDDGEVVVVYRRTRGQMPATEEELEGMEVEGVRLKELASPVRFLSEEGQVVGLECVRNELGEPGIDGRPRPVPVEGGNFEMEADSVIVAIGQRPDVSFLDGSSIDVSEWGTISVEPETGFAGEECVYAGGDAVRGPAIIVEACADGRRAAEAIGCQLGVEMARPSVEMPVLSPDDIARVKRSRARRHAPNDSPALSPESRQGFELVELTLSEEGAIDEGVRCLQCSTLCDKCVEVCPNRANYTALIEPLSVSVPRLSMVDGKLDVTGEEAWSVEQVRQIIHVDDFCNECGNCTTFCVHHGQPWWDKPRVLLNEADFDQASDGLQVKRVDDEWQLRRKVDGEPFSLVWEEGATCARYEDRWLQAEVEVPTFRLLSAELKEPFPTERSLVPVAEMWIILQAICQMTYLPI